MPSVKPVQERVCLLKVGGPSLGKMGMGPLMSNFSLPFFSAKTFCYVDPHLQPTLVNNVHVEILSILIHSSYQLENTYHGGGSGSGGCGGGGSSSNSSSSP